MRTDGQFSIHQVVLEDWMPDRTLTLIPFGDVHYGSPGHSDDEWKRFRDYAATVKDALFLGMGDYTDSFSASERSIIYGDALHESTLHRIENEGLLMVETLAKQLAFMKGRIAGLLGGNHFMSFQDGTTGDQVLARKLGCPYLGACTALRISFKRNNNHSVSAKLDIFAHHGRGGGRTAGGRMNSVEQLAGVAEADIYLMGDNHARGALPLGDKLVLRHWGGLHLSSRRCWIGRTGSFLRAYVPGQRSYVTDRALPPASLGWIEFQITPVRETMRDGKKCSKDRIKLIIQSKQ